MKLLATLGLALALAPVAANAAPVSRAWAVGQEREVDPGVYARLVAQRLGWTLWRFETQHDFSCHLVRQVAGSPQPHPLGVGEVLYNGSAFLEVVYYAEAGASMHVSYQLNGRYGSGATREYRRLGARFFGEMSFEGNLLPFDGQVIEVHVVSWEYPASHVGMSDETGLINLTGLREMDEAARACAHTP